MGNVRTCGVEFRGCAGLARGGRVGVGVGGVLRAGGAELARGLWGHRAIRGESKRPRGGERAGREDSERAAVGSGRVGGRGSQGVCLCSPLCGVANTDDRGWRPCEKAVDWARCRH